MNDQNLPWLARKLLWTDKKSNVDRIFWALALICAGLSLADFFYHKHGHYEIEQWPAIYGLVGFTVYAVVIFLAKGLRLIIKRPEDYYAPLSIDMEDERAAGSDPDAPEIKAGGHNA